MLLKISRTTLHHALGRREKIEDLGNNNSLWAFSGRLPRKDKVVVDALRWLIEFFWHDNKRVSPNQRDVVRRQIGSRSHESHAKHFSDMTQTQFYEKLVQTYP